LVTAFANDFEQRCLDCQTKDELIAIMNMNSQAKEETIARLTARIEQLTDDMNQLVALSQTFPSQCIIAEPSVSLSGVHAQPILPWASQDDFLREKLPNPTAEEPRSHFTAHSSNAHQATLPGSSTQPSFLATTSTYPSQRETQTETSEAPFDTNAEMSTPKPFELNDFVHDDYGPPPFNGDSAVYGTGGQFNGFQGTGADLSYL
jgi:hypothetical protein